MDYITLAHGAGGKKSHDLIKDVFIKHLGNDLLAKVDDAALIGLESDKIAFTTDSYVIKPCFFPGGDIGKIAVCGTVNDLAVCGARPLYLSCGFIIEEGFLIPDLLKIVKSMAQAADEAGVKIVTGDTKVVGRGEADGLFINTSGVEVTDGLPELDAANIKAGDKVIVTGTLGDHAIAILSKRKGLEFEGDLTSDCAPLNNMLIALLDNCSGVSFMRDPTRGGAATTLNEIAEGRTFGILINEEAVPVSEPVQGACELLGFDPLYLANEGKALVIVDQDSVGEAFSVLREHEYGKEAAVIGEITDDNPGKVCVRTKLGVVRFMDMLTGEQLPRIC